jgi:hypothetical protein
MVGLGVGVRMLHDKLKYRYSNIYSWMLVVKVGLKVQVQQILMFWQFSVVLYSILSAHYIEWKEHVLDRTIKAWKYKKKFILFEVSKLYKIITREVNYKTVEVPNRQIISCLDSCKFKGMNRMNIFLRFIKSNEYFLCMRKWFWIFLWKKNIKKYSLASVKTITYSKNNLLSCSF